MAAFLAAAAATPVEEWWTAGDAEVLIVQGVADVAAPVGNGRMLKQELGDRGTLVELPRVGHAMPVENPSACAEAVLAFLGRHG
jgi:pimeloyl-ACP methyl ester carboxylesterase